MMKKNGKNLKWLAATIFVLAGIVIGAVVGINHKKNRPVDATDLSKGISAQKVEELADLQPYHARVTDFGIRLFQNAMKEGESTLLSPLSVISALAMTANGAEGETLEQMEAVLGVPVEELNAYLYTYLQQLPEEEKYRLRLANSIWFADKESFQVEEEFLQTNKNYYGADVLKRTFDEEAAREINHWVEQKTDGMIEEILQEMPEDVVMYLVNALAFEAEWQKVYEDRQVREGNFTLEDGTKRITELMYSTEQTYLEDELATGLVKYYKDGQYAFVALLPKEGVTVAEYVNSLNGAHVQELLTGASDEMVYAAIPKFETEYDTELSQVLSQMGMPLAFDVLQADFSGLGRDTRPDWNISISRVLHKTFISVGEKGTKAGAVTAVEMMANGSSGMPGQPKQVYLDRPFVYMLVDTKNNQPFFIGTLMDVE